MQGQGPKEWKPARFQPTTAKKMPLIVFGDGMSGRNAWGAKRGNRAPVVGICRRLLKRRERRGELVVVEIDEYLTSQVRKQGVATDKAIAADLPISLKICHNCHKRSLNELTTADSVKHHGILSCKNCSMLWQRDVNASKNMFRIAVSIWQGNGRPTEFARVPRRSATTAVTNTVSL